MNVAGNWGETCTGYRVTYKDKYTRRYGYRQRVILPTWRKIHWFVELMSEAQ